MPLEVEDVQQDGANTAIVTVTSNVKSETTGTHARVLAIQSATPVIGKCGFSSFDFYTYRNPPDAGNPEGQLLSEEDMVTGKMKPGGTYLQKIKVKAGV